MDAAKYYALLRFEEAAAAFRAALKLNVVERIGDREVTPAGFRDLFGFTAQGARTFAVLLEVMEVLQRSGDVISIAPRAKETLTAGLSTSRRPYLSLGMGDDVDSLIEMLRGQFPSDAIPLYDGDGVSHTLMDQPEAAREIAYGLSSRARNFARPLADAIKSYAAKARIMADIGAGSPYIAQACLEVLPNLSKVFLVDRANGLVFARQMAESGQDSPEELKFHEHDFFDQVPAADLYCISNTAHDWLPDEYATIMTNIRDVIAEGGVVCIHEPLLLSNWNSAEEWVQALWMACYALTLFRLTSGKGTCYTRQEHNDVMASCGFQPIGEPVKTLDGCTALFYQLEGDAASHSPAQAATAPQLLRTRQTSSQ